MNKEKWLETARYAANYIWGYEALIDDHEDLFESLREFGDDPYDAVEKVGGKYDLTRVDEWMMELTPRTKTRFYAQWTN